ncbi:MAG TPA: hypothetical protein VGQ83_29715 [Polyangia bacterium]|jgi:hypothetical protein
MVTNHRLASVPALRGLPPRLVLAVLGVAGALATGAGCSSSSSSGPQDAGVDAPRDAAQPPDGSAGDAVTPGDAAGLDALPGDASRGPAYEQGTAGCPTPDGGARVVKLVNNCATKRWFKFDGRTTPLAARPTGCPWAGQSCTDIDGVAQCTAKAQTASPTVDPGQVYCKQNAAGTGGTCACNLHVELAAGQAQEIVLPGGADWVSATGRLATGCNALGARCSLGNDAANNSVFEFTYDQSGVTYDISAVDAWTAASPVGMKSCGVAGNGSAYSCKGAGCRFDVATQCPDGTAAFAAAPDSCGTCAVHDVGGKQVIADGGCGSCPNGSSANLIPTGTVFNPSGAGGAEWSWPGSPDFARAFGASEGARAQRRFACDSTTDNSSCTAAASGTAANTCLGGCMLCQIANPGKYPYSPECIKYCCPDRGGEPYDGGTYHYDSQGCTALGVQRATDYTVALKAACPFVYTYGYEDHSSTFTCDQSASLLIQACPDATDFPAQH